MSFLMLSAKNILGWKYSHVRTASLTSSSLVVGVHETHPYALWKYNSRMGRGLEYMLAEAEPEISVFSLFP
jgi:hypothetical protein